MPLDKSTANGAKIIHYDDNGDDAVQWRLEKIDTKGKGFTNQKTLTYLIPVGDGPFAAIVPYATYVEQDVNVLEHWYSNRKIFNYVHIVAHHNNDQNPELVGALQFNNAQLNIDGKNCSHLLKDYKGPSILPGEWFGKKGIIYDIDRAEVLYSYDIHSSYTVSVLTTLVVPTALFTYGEVELSMLIN